MPAFAATDPGPLENRKEYGSKPASRAKTTETFPPIGSVPLIPMNELVNALGAGPQSAELFCFWIKYEAADSGSWVPRRAVALPAEPRVNRAVDRDALPSQLAVRGNKAPTVGARLGRGSRRCRGSSGRDDVGGPRLHSAGGATGCDDHCSKKCRALHCEPPWLNMHDCKQVQSWSARKYRRHMQ